MMRICVLAMVFLLILSLVGRAPVIAMVAEGDVQCRQEQLTLQELRAAIKVQLVAMGYEAGQVDLRLAALSDAEILALTELNAAASMAGKEGSAYFRGAMFGAVLMIALAASLG